MDTMDGDAATSPICRFNILGFPTHLNWHETYGLVLHIPGLCGVEIHLMFFWKCLRSWIRQKTQKQQGPLDQKTVWV